MTPTDPTDGIPLTPADLAEIREHIGPRTYGCEIIQSWDRVNALLTMAERTVKAESECARLTSEMEKAKHGHYGTMHEVERLRGECARLESELREERARAEESFEIAHTATAERAEMMLQRDRAQSALEKARHGHDGHAAGVFWSTRNACMATKITPTTDDEPDYVPSGRCEGTMYPTWLRQTVEYACKRCGDTGLAPCGVPNCPDHPSGKTPCPDCAPPAAIGQAVAGCSFAWRVK